MPFPESDEIEKWKADRKADKSRLATRESSAFRTRATRSRSRLKARTRAKAPTQTRKKTSKADAVMARWDKAADGVIQEIEAMRTNVLASESSLKSEIAEWLLDLCDVLDLTPDTQTDAAHMETYLKTSKLVAAVEASEAYGDPVEVKKPLQPVLTQMKKDLP